jgi:predicted dehydrogenase
MRKRSVEIVVGGAHATLRVGMRSATAIDLRLRSHYHDASRTSSTEGITRVSTRKIRIGIVGSGAIVLANHLPGFALCPEAQVVALCDSNPDVLAKASRQTGIRATFTEYRKMIAEGDVDAVLIATPNHLHAPVAHAAIAAKKHVLCEKPIAMNYEEALGMYRAAEAAGVRHMTAFTYRFVPAMHYMSHLVKSGAIGKPFHFRTQRFQDWGVRPLGWRQVQKFAGTGEMGDMLSHRIDFGHLLMGRMPRLVAHTKRFIDERGGEPADVEDWVSIICDFENDASGVLESTKLATGRGEGGKSPDVCEVNGSEGTLVYQVGKPLEVQVGKKGGGGLESVPVPKEFLKWPISRRDVTQGDPVVTFRYDQDAEFIDAIVHGRACVPSFLDGAAAQAVLDAAATSAAERRWVEVAHPLKQ